MSFEDASNDTFADSQNSFSSYHPTQLGASSSSLQHFYLPPFGCSKGTRLRSTTTQWRDTSKMATSAEPHASEMNSCMLCTCGGGVNGQWEACKNADCPIEWFHGRCVGILYDMEGEWVCPRCLVEPAADPADDAVSSRQDSSVAVLPKPDNTGQKASKPDQQEKNVTVVTKARPRRRKPQRASRIVYETTETSIFENIIAESQAAALQMKEARKSQAKAKVQQVAKDVTSEGPTEDSSERESIELLVRKMRAKVERG